MKTIPRLLLTSALTLLIANIPALAAEGAGFDNVLHGVSDRRACYACHIALSFEPDNALYVRVHSIQSRSRRFSAEVQK